MNKEHGYMNLDFGGFIIFIGVVSAFIGAGLFALCSFLWPIFVSWLHAITA